MPDEFAVRIVKIQVIIAVPLTLVDEQRVIPRQEQDGMLGFDVLGMCFLHEGGHQFTGFAVISAKFCMVLLAVQFYEIEALSVGRPADIGKVAIGGVAGIQVNGLLSVRIINTYGNLMAEHACHRVAYFIHQSYSGGNVHQGIGGYHAFVHTVKGQKISLRTPKSAFADAELIAVHTLPAHNSFGFLGYGLVVHKKVVLYGIGYVSSFRSIVDVAAFPFSCLRHALNEFVFFKVINDVFCRQFDKHIRLVRPWEFSVMEMLHFTSLLSGYGCCCRRRGYQ